MSVKAEKKTQTTAEKLSAMDKRIDAMNKKRDALKEKLEAQELSRARDVLKELWPEYKKGTLQIETVNAAFKKHLEGYWR